MRDAEITCPNSPSCSSSCSGNATGRTTARSAWNTTRQQPGSTPTSPGVIRAAPSCTAGSPARCAACPTRTTAASWKKCSPAGPPSSSSIPPPPSCSTRTGESPARGKRRTWQDRRYSPRRQSACGPFIEQAFTREHVTIDFAGFSGETLHGVIQEPLDKIRIGLIKPATVTIRLLLPDTSRPMVLPCRADDLTDDPDYRTRMHRLTFRHAHAILDTVQELASLGLIQDADVQIRAHGCPPLFKLYILNGEDVFFGFYPITRHTIPLASGTARHLRPDGERRRGIPPLRAQRPARRPALHRADTRLVQRHVGQHQLRVPCMTSPAANSSDLDAIVSRDPPPAPGLRRARSAPSSPACPPTSSPTGCASSSATTPSCQPTSPAPPTPSRYSPTRPPSAPTWPPGSRPR